MSRTKNAESLSRKESIVSALEDLLKERDLSDITVTDLCARCNISRQLFYYHFDNMEALFLWSVKTSTEEDTEKVSLVGGICDVCEAFLSRKILTDAFFSSEYRDTIIGMIRSDFQMEAEHYVMERIGGSLPENQRRMLIMIIMNGSLGIITDWIDDGMRIPVSDIHAILTLLVDTVTRIEGP